MKQKNEKTEIILLDVLDILNKINLNIESLNRSILQLRMGK